MSHTARWISKLAPLFLVLASGCTLFDKPPDTGDKIIKKASQQRIFFAPMDQVWRAAHTVLKYTIATENPDTGVIETEYIKGVDGWLAPDQKRPPSAGLRYKLVFIMAKGKTDGRESTRLTIDKRIEVLRDFFSEPDAIESDGLEESVLFYRIERELVINEALKRAG
ncbi:MAG: hypothetical protein KF802_05010 [Bdellovibrionaceae bacterium]|nr:hypothetical protein [Pseudobdellovibrionaceae bacterium]